MILPSRVSPLVTTYRESLRSPRLYAVTATVTRAAVASRPMPSPSNHFRVIASCPFMCVPDVRQRITLGERCEADVNAGRGCDEPWREINRILARLLRPCPYIGRREAIQTASKEKFQHGNITPLRGRDPHRGG